MASFRSSQATAKDQWTTQKYSNAASFVPQLTTKVVQYLDPQPNDVILDVGCGDGILSAEIASRCAKLIGVDSSNSFIDTAKSKYTSSHPNASFFRRDCRRLVRGAQDFAIAEDDHILARESYAKVFSNAALHWILRDEETRKPLFGDIFALLKPNGSLVFEMGGFGNVAAVHTAIYAVLRLKFGIPLEKIKATDPWFFPSVEWMRQTLHDAGFEVQIVEAEARQTKATPKSEDGTGGLEGWVNLMAANFLDLLESQADRDVAVQTICTVLSESVTKVEDGSQWLDYFRLRAVAKKPLAS